MGCQMVCHLHHKLQMVLSQHHQSARLYLCSAYVAPSLLVNVLKTVLNTTFKMCIAYKQDTSLCTDKAGTN